MKVKKILELPISGLGCANIRVIANSVELLVQYGFNSIDDDSRQVGKILFKSLISYSFRSTMHGMSFIKYSYDSLVEIKSSDYIKWLLEIEPPMIARSAANKRHFAIFFTDNGYLEVIAKSYEVLPYEYGKISCPEFDKYID